MFFQTAKKTVGCIPWYLPQSPTEDNVICDPWTTKEFLNLVQGGCCFDFHFVVYNLSFFTAYGWQHL